MNDFVANLSRFAACLDKQRCLSQMKVRPLRQFSDVPSDQDGHPLNVTRTQAEFDAYVDWLADYLYQPSAQMPFSAILSLEQAWPSISRIETEIAAWIWDHPFDDYPPDNYQPRHADILHRRELSRILSRVADHGDRRELFVRFYRELGRDSLK